MIDFNLSIMKNMKNTKRVEIIKYKFKYLIYKPNKKMI